GLSIRTRVPTAGFLASRRAIRPGSTDHLPRTPPHKHNGGGRSRPPPLSPPAYPPALLDHLNAAFDLRSDDAVLTEVSRHHVPQELAVRSEERRVGKARRG